MKPKNSIRIQAFSSIAISLGRLAVFPLLLAILALAGSGVAEAAIAGSSPRPFPVLMPLDYSACRAQAWINALGSAVRQLPSFASLRLDELEMNSSLARLALCALVYPADVVTPDISASDRITVYLREPGNIPGEIANVLRNPDRLALEMCLIAELRAKLEELGQIWPPTLAEARSRMADLERIAASLDGLWEALELNGEDGAHTSHLHRLPAIMSKSGDSIGASLMLANFQLMENRPQMALEAADNAVRKSGTIASRSDLWRLMLGKAYALRGRAHWRLGQFALAEADMNAAESILSGFEHKFLELPLALLSRGALKGLRHDRDGMCADFFDACVLGSCEGLAAARGRGECLDMNR